MSDLILRQPALPALLDARTLEYLEAARSDNTKKTYAAAWTDFETFCVNHRLEPLPAAVPTVAAYVIFLAEAQRVSTLRVKLAAISDRHRRAALPDPTLDGRVRDLMRGIRRKRGAPPEKKAPLTREKLFPIVEALDQGIAHGALSPLRGARNKALLVLAFAGGFRRSELVGLDVSDLEFTKTEMFVHLRRSKTDQEARGQKKRIPRLDVDAPHAAVCPVRLVRAWLRRAQIRKGPVFRAIDQYDHVRAGRLSDRALAEFIKQAVAMIGLDPAAYSGHSTRSGNITQGFLDGFAEWEVQALSGHRSRPILQGYNLNQEEAQARVVRGILGQGHRGDAAQNP